jgi:uncharacterized repeat protein (TIGR01451 family)
MKIALLVALLPLAGCQTVGTAARDTTRTVFHANDVETVEAPGPERFWNKAGIVISPARSIAQVGTEVPIFAGICDDKGQLQPYEKVEWMLDNCSVGSLVSVNEPMRPFLLDLVASKTHKVDNNYAISETLPANVILTRGTPNINDDMVMPRGYSWVTVTSPTEGISYLTAHAPDVYSWDARQKNAVIHWINAEWTFPEAGCVPPGAGAALVTCVQRRTNKTAVSDWIVKYTITGGAEAGFGAENAQSVEVATDETGKATAELNPAGNAAGTTCISVELIKPGCEADDEPERLSIATAATHVNWSTTQLTLRVAGPSEATVGATAGYRIEVSNTGRVAGNDVIVTLSPLVGAAILKSTPAADSTSPMVWRLGQVAGGEMKTISFDARVDQPGPLRVSATLTAGEGLTAESSATTNVRTVVVAPAAPSTAAPPITSPPPTTNTPPTTTTPPLTTPPAPPKVEIEITGPQTAKLGEDVKFDVQITNRGNTVATGLSVTDRFDKGLQHGADQSPIRPERQLGDLQPGESKRFALTFRVMQPGNLCHTVEVTGPGGLNVSKQACISVPADAPQVEQSALSVSIKTPQQAYRVGDLALFTVEIVNTGTTVAAKDLRASIVFEQGLQPTRAQDADNPKNKLIPRGLEYSVETLRPGERFIRVVECKCVNVTLRACGSVTATDVSQNPIMSDACVQILAAQGGAVRPNNLNLQLASNDNPVRVGNEVFYTLTVRNTGAVSEKQVRVSITVPDSLSYLGSTGQVRESSTDLPNVRFEPILELRAGEPIKLQLRFKAMRAGPAQVTAEATSPNLDQPLTSAAAVSIF